MDLVKLIILIVTIVVVATLNFLIRKYFKSPKLHLDFFSVIWALLLFLSIFSEPPNFIQPYTFAIFAMAWVMVYAGSLVACIFFSGSNVGLREKINLLDDYLPDRLLKSLVIVLFLSIIGNYLFYTSIFSKLETIEGLIELRGYEGQELIQESGNILFNIFGRIYVLYIPLSLYLFKIKKLSFMWMLIIILYAIVTAFGTLTRAPLLFLGLIIVSSIVILNIRIPKSVVIFTGIIFSGLFIFTTAQIIEFLGEEFNSRSFLSFFSDYFIGSLAAFEEMLNGQYYDPMIYQSKFYSLDFINYFLQKLYILDSYPSLVRNYAVRVNTNVYTYLDVFQLDFGLPGLIIGPFILGFLCGYLGSKLDGRPKIHILILYIYGVYALTFSFMNNEFIRSYYVIILGITYLIHTVSLKNKTQIVQ